MKLITKMFFCVLATLLFSCNSNDNEISEQPNVTTNKVTPNSYSSTNRISTGDAYNIILGDDRYELLEDNSVSFYKNGVYQYDISLASTNMDIVDESTTKGLVTVTNPETEESVKISNIIQGEDNTRFDVLTSSGREIGMRGYYGTTASRFPIKPIIKAIVAIVTIIAATSDNPSQSDCAASLGQLHCPNGTHPYMNYSGGWFSSTCNIGCRK